MTIKQKVFLVLGVAGILGLAYWIRQPVRQAEPLDAASASIAEPSLGSATAAEIVTPELIESLTTASARITRGDGSEVSLRSVDGEFDRLQVDPNEHLKIQIVLNEWDASLPIRVEADHGGSLNQRVGPLSLRPETDDGSIEFDFAVGGNTGRYTLFISQGGRQEVLDFRAGPEPPTGPGGPVRIFNPERT